MSLLGLLIILGVTVVLAIASTVMIIWRLGAHDREVRARIAAARKAGRHETLSLHPVVDEGKCIGCEECVRGCPEQDVLLTYRNKAVVVDAADAGTKIVATEISDSPARTFVECLSPAKVRPARFDLSTLFRTGLSLTARGLCAARCLRHVFCSLGQRLCALHKG